ncbi:WDR75 protein, partial [Chauna torquata]|nr:WDR75 protein [Chauna torquata]
YLLCASGDFVKMYSAATEELVRAMRGHADLVTGLQLNPHNRLQLYSSSLDGSIKLWDFTDGILIKTFTVGYKLLALYALASSEDSVFVIIPKSGERDTFQLVSVKLTKTAGQDTEAKELSVVLEGVDASPKCTAFGREGEYVASVKEVHLQIYFFKRKQLNRFSVSATNTKGGNNLFTCVACHPKEDCIATGHGDGKIRLWRNFHHNKEYTFSTLHWHHDIVMDLAFSIEGTSLLSGGVESVLVQWHNGSDCKKDFLPRLGSAIEYISISSDGTLYCTSHTDNRITIINSNLRFSKSIQGLIKARDVKTGLVVDPRTKALVLNGEPGHLQFYCLQSDKQLYSLDIVQQEYIHQAGLNQADLVKVAFSAQGKWLATVEEREEETDLELQLKLWFFDEETQSFKLNTRISMPHEDHITAMCFRDMDELEDDSLILVTAGRDCLFKVWVMLEDTDPEAQQSLSWSCDFVGSYHNYQATNCCFSEDGSVLAVSFEETVTVWDSSTWDLKCTFCHPPGKIRNICFGRLTCSKYLIGATDHGFLCCWNLLSCALEWSAHLNVVVLQPDPLSEHIAAVSWLSKESSLFVFKPNEPRPICIQRNLCKEKIRFAAFVPRDVPETIGSEKYLWLRRSQLYFLTDTQELMTFSTKSPEERLTLSSKQLAVEESLPVTPFSLLLGKHRQQSQGDIDHGKVVRNHHEQDSPAVKELLHTPAHVLPSASFLCPIFINSLLISKEKKSAEEVADEVEMESEKAEDDSDEEKDVTEMEQEDIKPMELVGEITHKLSKSEEKELRKIRKMDYSWISAF